MGAARLVSECPEVLSDINTKVADPLATRTPFIKVITVLILSDSMFLTMSGSRWTFGMSYEPFALVSTS